MQSRRSTLGVSVLNDELYAVGGFDGTNGLDTVEKYNPGEHYSSQTPPIWCFIPLTSPSLPLLCPLSHLLTETKMWVNVASMSTRRSSVGLAVLNGYLYAVGGYDGVARQCLNSVERYDPEADEWSPVEPMTQRRSGAAVAVLENMVYAIGGHNGPDIRKSVERCIESNSKHQRVPLNNGHIH